MHELSVCQGLLRQVERVATDHNARRVERILLRIGALSGVEPTLLERAFEAARLGTRAERAELCIEAGPIVVRCRTCGGYSTVPPNRLLCGACGNWQVTVTEGEELTLLSVDLEM
ncbi:MAG: hydrogenase maturation nickel metallochaperone HypA [Xanthomonadales bacterium]|nr:hydrogenase maturation nickel metallochaperone HypA [Xanthomonadales bacterium]